MALLSVNVNKVATLRNSRGNDQPNLRKVTQDILNMGVAGITIHPRPDERHIKRSDVAELTELLKVYPEAEFNIEGYPSDDFLNLISKHLPHQCTLVPDPPEVLTSNAGWKLKENSDFLRKVCTRLKSCGVKSSVFIDPLNFEHDDLVVLQKIGADRVELYTESYAKNYNSSERSTLTKEFKRASLACQEIGVGVNAGHDLNLENLAFLLQEIPEIKEVSIGHAIFCDALYLGLELTIKKYLEICNEH